MEGFHVSDQWKPSGDGPHPASCRDVAACGFHAVGAEGSYSRSVGKLLLGTGLQDGPHLGTKWILVFIV